MTSLRHTLSASALAASLLAAFAAPAGAQAHPHAHGMQDTERGPQAHERRMTELKNQLQLSPAQEDAWTQFAKAMRPMPPAQRHNPEALMKLPTPERIDQMRAMHQQHIAQMEQRGEATKAFYATLTPEQKKRFDEQTARMMQREGGMGPGHHGQHRRHG